MSVAHTHTGTHTCTGGRKGEVCQQAAEEFDGSSVRQRAMADPGHRMPVWPSQPAADHLCCSRGVGLGP